MNFVFFCVMDWLSIMDKSKWFTILKAYTHIIREKKQSRFLGSFLRLRKNTNTRWNMFALPSHSIREEKEKTRKSNFFGRIWGKTNMSFEYPTTIKSIFILCATLDFATKVRRNIHNSSHFVVWNIHTQIRHSLSFLVIRERDYAACAQYIPRPLK